MIKQHDHLILPDKMDEKIWRYMDFTKFVSLLDKKALFFCRVDKLGDQFEMSRPKANYASDKEFYDKYVEPRHPDWPFDRFLQVMNLVRWSVLINSWHRNEHESAAMWSHYSKSNEGIAIQTTNDRLSRSLSSNNDEVMISVVNYLDYNSDFISNDSILGLVTHKLKSYDHERELRAILISQSDEKMRPLFEIGKYVEVEMEVLIDKIYLAPNSPRWFHELVKSVVDKYGYNFEIISSGLNDHSLH